MTKHNVLVSPLKTGRGFTTSYSPLWGLANLY